MSKAAKPSKKDDEILFADEKGDEKSADELENKKYKLLIVDDEKEVHVMTKLVLSDYSYAGGGLEFYSAYSGKEAETVLKAHADIAVVLLDVVMETKDAGLNVAKFIREDLLNHKTRIILRTGQPGKAPEKEIILNYDINDYKEKTELTTQKLFTTVTTALRSYLHLEELGAKTKEIEAKNVRLNEEIARRIVAESNLNKYNRSLEKMIDNKSQRLKQALDDLSRKEDMLLEADRLVQVGNITATALPDIDQTGSAIGDNLETIDDYRTHMVQLLEKYEVLQDIITSNVEKTSKLKKKTDEMIQDIDLLKEEINFSQILKKYPEIIKDSASGIKQIGSAVNDIKMFISVCDEKFVSSDINNILDEVLSSLLESSHKEIDVQKNFQSLPLIMAAPDSLKKAFAQIFSNSIDALGTKGILSIESNYEPDTIFIHISDNGEGISKEDQAMIFKPYFTTKDGNNRGLGLPYAKSVLIKHKGIIEVASNAQQGSSVAIKIRI